MINVLAILMLAAASLSAAEKPAAAGDKSVTAKPAVPATVAKITSASTYYDRKNGYAYFSGKVFVDDEKYRLHADRAYVFMNASNELQRIVAMGNVAITNETKRAYGAKAAYFRNPGMVVLYSGDGVVAEVRDEKSGGDQTVRGKKIKFWIDAEQVEVVEAELSAPAVGGGEQIKSALGGR